MEKHSYLKNYTNFFEEGFKLGDGDSHYRLLNITFNNPNCTGFSYHHIIPKSMIEKNLIRLSDQYKNLNITKKKSFINKTLHMFTEFKYIELFVDQTSDQFTRGMLIQNICWFFKNLIPGPRQSDRINDPKDEIDYELVEIADNGNEQNINKDYIKYIEKLKKYDENGDAFEFIKSFVKNQLIPKKVAWKLKGGKWEVAGLEKNFIQSESIIFSSELSAYPYQDFLRYNHGNNNETDRTNFDNYYDKYNS